MIGIECVDIFCKWSICWLGYFCFGKFWDCKVFVLGVCVCCGGWFGCCVFNSSWIVFGDFFFCFIWFVEEDFDVEYKW